MLWKTIRAECFKLKRSPIWIAFFLMPVIPALLGTLNYLNNLEILQSEWYSLWTQHTLFTDYFFLPIMIGIYAAFSMRQEETNRNWNKILSMPISKSLVLLAKLCCNSLMVLLSQIWIVALFVLSGKLAGITAPIPCQKLIVWCLFGTLGGMVIASIQLTISLLIRSFAIPIGIALGGGISGLIFLAKNLGHIWPYSLMAYGMNANAPQELMKTGYLSFVLTCVCYLVCFTLLGQYILNKKEF